MNNDTNIYPSAYNRIKIVHKIAYRVEIFTVIVIWMDSLSLSQNSTKLGFAIIREDVENVSIALVT